MVKQFGTKLNKKGSLQDIILIALICVAFAVIVLISFKITSEFNTHIQANADIPTNAKTSSTKIVGFFPGLLDNMFLFILFGLGIGSIILASLVRIHPVFIGLYLFALVIVIIIAGILSDVYTTMAADPQLSGLASQLTNITLFITYWPLVIGVLGSLLAIIMYKQWQND